MKSKYNEFQRNGKAFVRAVNRIVSSGEQENLYQLNETLNCFHLKKGFKFLLRIANHFGMGDESSFYTYNGKEDLIRILNKRPFINRHDVLEEFEDIEIEPTAMGAWQALMYHLSPTILPTFWHGGYIRRTWIFSDVELRRINPQYTPLPIEIGTNPFEGIDILPFAEIKDNRATVNFYSWSDWGGLFRETSEITFKDNKVISIECIEDECLYEYDCGVCF
mgnify:CR=1 FL=1